MKFGETISQVATSKKALAAAAGVLVVFVLTFIGYQDKEAIDQIVQLVMAYIIGQGVADFGKYRS